jgi:hypothetical protein
MGSSSSLLGYLTNFNAGNARVLITTLDNSVSRTRVAGWSRQAAKSPFDGVSNVGLGLHSDKFSEFCRREWDRNKKRKI